MKKLLTVLFAALMSTSMLMAQEATKAPEKESKKPVKTKHVKAKKEAKKTMEEKKDDTKK